MGTPIQQTCTTPMDRLQALDNVETEILNCIHAAGQALAELAKDKPSGKLADQHVAAFMKNLNHVESEIGRNIAYLTQVSTGHSHEGSSYASQKVLQMAWHRSEHARSKLDVHVSELNRIKKQMQQLAQRPGTGGASTSSQPQQQGPGPGVFTAGQPQPGPSGQQNPSAAPPSVSQVHSPQTPSYSSC